MTEEEDWSSLARSQLLLPYLERARVRTFLNQLGNIRSAFREAAAVQLIQEEQAVRLELAASNSNLKGELSKLPA